RHDRRRSGQDGALRGAVLDRGGPAGRGGHPAHARSRLLADLHHRRGAAGRIAERDAPVRGAAPPARRDPAAGLGDHAAGVSVRRHLDERRAARADDHAGEPGGAGPRLQDGQDVHHHPLGRDQGAVLRTAAAACVAAVILAAAGGAQAPRRMALTFDDLPGVATPSTLAALEDVNARLLATLRILRIPAIGFVNEGRLEVEGEREARIELLRSWLAAGMTLGNHTYAHRDINDTPVAEYRDE